MAVWSEVFYSKLWYDVRTDSEFYRPEHLRLDDILKLLRSRNWGELEGIFIVGPFGSSFLVENYVKDSSFRYIRGKDVKPFLLADDDSCYIPQKDFERLKKYRLYPGDLLISVVGTIGNVAIITEDVRDAIFSCKSTAYRSKEIDPYFLCTYLNSKVGQTYLQRMIRGHIQTGLNLNDLKKIPISVFEHDRILKISNILKNAFSKVKDSKKLYQQAEQLLLRELGLEDFEAKHELCYTQNFSEVLAASRSDAEFFQPKYYNILNKISKHPIKKLGEIINYKKGIEPGSNEYEDEGIPFIRISDISINGIERTEKKISEKLSKEYKSKYSPRKGEIILSKDGTIGIAFVVYEDLNVVLSSGLLRLILQEEKINKEYLALVLNSIVGRLQMEKYAGGALISHLKPSDAMKIQIPTLPDKKQKEISELIINSHKARMESKQLLEQAKKMVEDEILKEK